MRLACGCIALERKGGKALFVHQQSTRE